MTASTVATSCASRVVLPARNAIAWPLLTLAFCVLAAFTISLSRAINWDEFYHYSQIHEFARGELATPMQTTMARIFSWSASLPGNGIDHIVTLRMVMVSGLCVASGNIYLIAGRFAQAPVALLCSLLYLSAGYVLQHGSSYRADPLAAALLTGSLAIMVRSRLGPASIVLAGLLAAGASLITIKCVLYAPAFAGIAWLRWSEAGYSREMFLRLFTMLLSFGVFFAVLLWCHGQGLATSDKGNTAGTVGSFATGSAKKMFELGALPYIPHILKGAVLAPLLSLCILLVPYLLWRGREQGARRIALTGLWLPICAPLIYHNTAPYFFVFILPPAAAACAIALSLLVQRYSVAMLSGFLALLAAMTWMNEDPSRSTNSER